MPEFDFKTGLMGQLSVVGTNGKLFLPPQTSKDSIHEAITWSIYPEFAERRKIDKHKSNGQVKLDNPIFVHWTSTENSERNSIKFSRIIGQIEDIMGLTPTIAYPVEAGAGGTASPFVAKVDSWWMKSPISVSAYLLFMRLSIAMRFDEPLDAFINRMLNIKAAARYSIKRDAGYLESAHKKGNLSGLFQKTLPCLKRDSYSDYLLSKPDRGFSNYSIAKDKKLNPYEQVQSKNAKKLISKKARAERSIFGLSFW